MAEAEHPAVGTEEEFDITEFEAIKQRLQLHDYAWPDNEQIEQDIGFLYALARTLIKQRDALIQEIYELKLHQEAISAWRQRAELAESEIIRVKARLREAEKRSRGAALDKR